MTKAIALIVEGDGDFAAVPELFRKTCWSKGYYDVVSSRPIKVGDLRGAIKNDKFLRYFAYALEQPSVAGVLVCLDADDDCPVTAAKLLAARVLERVESSRIPTAICLFPREYESMFIACVDQLAENNPDLRRSGMPAPPWETRRDAKGTFSACFTNFSYKETRDQIKFTSRLDLELCARLYNPYAHFVRAVEWIVNHDGGSGMLYPVR